MRLHIEKSDNRYKTLKQLHKEDDVFSNYKVKCKCSHVIIISNDRDKVLCSHCGYYVYRDKKEEFKNILLRRMNNG